MKRPRTDGHQKTVRGRGLKKPKATKKLGSTIKYKRLFNEHQRKWE